VGDLARGNWTDIIAGGCGTMPFYYVAGNHEIIGTLTDDPEWRCNALGSVSCRPYYSFDLQGIHFVSLPELVQPIYINQESIEWLTLDLEVNKDKTVILFSHNNIRGTTTPMGEIGYRGLVNSRELVELFKRHRNVVAWMHGHNHTYEVLEKDGMLYVSNGRIGGFIPPKLWGRMGQGHLGGIYFEIAADSLKVRAYSATEEKFFDEMGDGHLSGSLSTKTSFDPAAKAAYSFGVGGMSPDQMIPVFNHHLARGAQAELFVKRSDATTINDDPAFALYEFRNAGQSGNQWLLMGASVGTPKYFEKENTLWEWRNPGLRLLRQPNPDTAVDVAIPDWHFSKYAYYRGVPGKRYRVTMDVYALAGGQTLELELCCYDSLGYELKRIAGPSSVLEVGAEVITSAFDIPQLAEVDTIYQRSGSDKMIQLSVRARFKQMKNDVYLNNFALSEEVEHPGMSGTEVLIDGRTFSPDAAVGSGTIGHCVVPAPQENRMVFQTKQTNSLGLTWLYRHNAIEWQVRNATVSDRGNFFEIGALRNTWTLLEEIVIAPFNRGQAPFVHRLRNISRARVYPLDRNNQLLKVEIVECAAIGTVQVFSLARPKEVAGGLEWEYSGQLASIKVQKGSNISISFLK
jgi:hypothetical protein